MDRKIPAPILNMPEEPGGPRGVPECFDFALGCMY